MEHNASRFKNGRMKRQRCAWARGCQKKSQGRSELCWNHQQQTPAGRASARDRALLRKYSLPLGEFAELMKIQNGVCGICEFPQPFLLDNKPAALCVDHDHESGVVRGLLCTPCNVALGHFREDPRLLTRAIMWLGMTELPDEKFVWVTEREEHATV